MSDHLFDVSAYGGLDPVLVDAPSPPTVEPYTPPWVLLANRHGVIGFHWPQSSDNGTVFSECGMKGHSVAPPETMVRCSVCERLRQLP